MYSIHTHPESLNDTANNLHNMIMEFINAGFKGFAATDHGENTSYEDLQEILGKIKKKEKEAAKEEGREPNSAIMDFKIYKGIETYVETNLGPDIPIDSDAHMILIASTPEGERQLNKVISEAARERARANTGLNSGEIVDLKTTKSKAKKKISNTKPIIPIGLMEKYITPGNIYATSACIGGAFGNFFGLNKSPRAEYEAKKAELEALIAERDEALSAYADEGVQMSAYDIINTKLSDFKVSKEDKERIKEKKAQAKEIDKRYKKAVPDLEEKVEKLRQETEEFEKTYNEENAKALLDRFIKIFGTDHYFLEIQNHFLEKEKVIYNNIIRFGLKYHPMFIASNDIHVGASKTSPNYENALKAFNVAKWKRFSKYKAPEADDKEYCIKNNKELKEALMQLDDGKPYVLRDSNIPLETIVNKAIANTGILTKCDFTKEKATYYPKFNKDWDDETTFQYFLSQLEEGKKRLFPDGYPSPEYEKRLQHEIDIIHKMGYVDYHLIVQEYNKYARTKGKIVTGPGRGSAAGSLVCYQLGITGLDPIKYGLLFERFLNPERVSMPDIDMDFAKAIREDVINHCIDIYGADNVCNIVTKSYSKIKGAIGLAARYLASREIERAGLNKTGLSKEEKAEQDIKQKEIKDRFDAQGKKLSNALDTEKGSDEELFEFLEDNYIDPEDEAESTDEIQNEELDESALNDVLQNITEDSANRKDYEKILNWAKVIKGFFNSYGMHACGVLISNSDIGEILPLRLSDNNKIETSCTYPQAENMGLLKMDFLGLITLDMLNDCVAQTGDTTICDEVSAEKALNDPEVYKHIFSSGLTSSVFQFGSAGMKQMLKDFKPSSFEDIILLVACYRPGPMKFLRGKDDNGEPCTNIINVKNGKEPLTYMHPSLEHILCNTYGAIVYQEQVMQIFQDCAGYNLGQADLVRRAMGKKHLEDLIPERQAFIYGDEERGIEGCIKKVSMSEAIANKLFDQMIDFASYAFNKSHAAAYAKLSVFTAYMLEHHPKEWMCSYLNYSKENKRKTKKLPALKECRQLGITLLPPAVDHGFVPFEVADDHSIRYGSGFIKGMSFDNIHYPDSVEEMYEMIINGFEEPEAELTEETNTMASVLSEEDNEYEAKAKAENMKFGEPKIAKMFELGLIKEIWKDDRKFNGRMNAQFLETFNFMQTYFQSLVKAEDAKKKAEEKLRDTPVSETKKYRDLVDDFEVKKAEVERLRTEIKDIRDNLNVEHTEETLKDIVTARTAEFESVGVFFTHPESLDILSNTEDVPKKALEEKEQNDLVTVAATLISISDKKTARSGKEYYEVKLMLKDGTTLVRRMSGIPTVLNGYYKVYNEAGRYFNSSPKATPIEVNKAPVASNLPTSVFGINKGVFINFINCPEEDFATNNKLLSMGIDLRKGIVLKDGVNNDTLIIYSCTTNDNWPLAKCVEYMAKSYPTLPVVIAKTDAIVAATRNQGLEQYPNIFFVDTTNGKCYNMSLEEREDSSIEKNTYAQR